MNKKHELIVIPTKQSFYLDVDYLTEIDDLQYKFEQQFKEEFDQDNNLAIFNLGLVNNKQKMSLSLHYLYYLSRFFLTKLIQTPDLDDVKEKVVVEIDNEKIEYYLRISPFNNIDKQWIKAIWNIINEGYKKTLELVEGSIQEYLYKKNKSLVNSGKVCFHLVENKFEPSKFAFLATYQFYDIESARVKNVPIKRTLEQYSNNNEQLLKVLSPITTASNNSLLINGLMESGEIFYPITLNKDEAFTFLIEIPLYEQANIICKVPNWWKKKYKTSLGIKVGNKKSYLNFEELADFQVELHLGNLNIDLNELEEIIKLDNGITQYKGEWIQIDKEKLIQLKNAYLKVVNQLNKADLTLFDALKLELGEIKKNEFDDVEVEVTQGEWIQNTLQKIINNNHNYEITLSDDFLATLRPYQTTGVQWLNTMKELRLGCCLADDMGLGKTIQVLALLNEIKTKNEKSLLVIPASLIGNWMSELSKFTPNLKYLIFHSNYLSDDDNDLNIDDYDLIITTYSMLNKFKILKDTVWDNIILDEAQAIKNPSTIQSKTIRNLQAKYRLALTGTPIENRLSDLWSLFDFLNKGLLGSNREFKEFIKGLNDDGSYYERLKNQIKPFILRRLKTDKTIISDLPEKIENKVYANLSKKQLALYKETVDSLQEKLDSLDGIERKGLILQAILKFKQICNHPSQYYGNEDYEISESGKFELLKDICENIAYSRERVLIFTQFREITAPLDDFLFSVFGKRGLVLTGNTQVKKRKELVDLFQSEAYIPYMIITVKAGGVGLNLTNANHVIHFDRWWNPAVENQATDRAYRIGQHKNVIVHKFITKNTVEEKIDAMIMDKIKISDSLIGDNSETTIMNMSNQEIINLFKLEEVK